MIEPALGIGLRVGAHGSSSVLILIQKFVCRVQVGDLELECALLLALMLVGGGRLLFVRRAAEICAAFGVTVVGFLVLLLLATCFDCLVDHQNVSVQPVRLDLEAGGP